MKKLAEMPMQEIFDRVAYHLLTQAGPSIEDGACQYRAETESGEIRKCAIGIFIPDAEYNSEMEGKDASALFTLFPEVFGEIDSFRRILCKLLQLTHDTISKNANYWNEDEPGLNEYGKKQLAIAAHAFDLHARIMSINITQPELYFKREYGEKP